MLSVENRPSHSPESVDFKPSNSFLKQVLEKIKAIAKKIFDCIFFWRQKPPLFTKNQRESIQKAVEVRHKINLERTSFIEKQDAPIEKRKRNPLPSAEDPSLKHLNIFLEELGPILVNDCIQNEIVKPAIPTLIESANNIHETIEPLAKASTAIIDALDPFIQKISIMADLPEIISYTKEVVQLLIKKGEPDEKRIPIEWINESNELFLKAKDTHQLINLFLDALSFFKSFAHLLEEGKLQPEIEAIQQCISNDLEVGFERLFEINTPEIMKLLAERVDELIFHLPYSKTFDKLIVEVHRHIDIWDHANEAMKGEKLTIEKAQLVATNPKSTQIDSELSKSYLGKIEAEGGEEVFLNKKFSDVYKEEYQSRFIIRKKEKSEIKLDRLQFFKQGSPEKVLGDICKTFSESLYKTLLPPKEVKLPLDTSVKLNGLTDIWDITELSEPFVQIIAHLDTIINSVIGNCELKNHEVFRTYLHVLIKKYLLEQAHQKVQGVIATGIQNLFHKLTDPSQLDELFADIALPAIVDQLILSFARTLLLRHINEMAPLFEDFIEKPSQKKRESILSSIFDLMQKNTEHYDLGEDRQKFDSLVNPLITELSENLLLRLKRDSPNRKLTAEEVELAINTYFESEKVETNPEYGKIVTKLLFRMGSFGGSIKEWIFSFMEGTIAEGVTLSFKDTQKSFHQVINTATNSMRANYLNPENLRETFFSPPPSEEQVQLNRDRVKEKLPTKIHTLAALIRDILYENLYANSTWIKHYYMSTPSVETLENTITNLFENLFKRDLLNQNLLFQGFHIFNKALSKSVANSELQKRIHFV